MTYGDVLAKLASTAGLSSDVTSTSGTGQVNDYLLQTGSDLAFVDSIARRCGCVWWTDGSHLRVRPIAASDGEVALELNRNLLEFSVRATGLRPTKVTVTGWDRDQQENISSNHNSSAHAAPRLLTDYVGSKTETLGAAESSFGHLLADTSAEATTLAAAVGAEGDAGAVIARGRCDVNSSIAPAVTVKITDAGPASGSYLVNEVEHVYTHRGFFTRFMAGPGRPIGLVDTLGRREPDPGFAMSGLVVGKVSNLDAQDKTGRAKVSFPSYEGAIESAWARVVSLGGGSARGVVFQPEVGDEVLVGFEYGDSRRPVIIGGLFSSKNKLPEADKLVGGGGTVDYRRITSRKNHVIELADGTEPDKQHILLQLGTAAHKVRLGADSLDIEVAEGKPVTIKAGGAKFAISSSGDIAIEANNISIKAKMKLDLEGTSAANLKSQAEANVQGAMVKVAGQSMASVEGGASLALKGGMVQIN
jgi:uncharacterized protein involved in type VI secretion and phage assembly